MSPIRMSRLETGIRVVLDYYEAFNRRDTAALARLVDEDCAVEGAGPVPGLSRRSGREAAVFQWQELFRERPGLRLEVEEIFGLGPRCVARWRLDWEGAEGEKRHERGVDLFQLRNGLVHELQSYVKR